jgi:hypothetical protein
MSYVDVIDEMRIVNKRLSNAIIELNRLAKAKAEAERVYRLAIFKTTVELKEQGFAMTIIPDMAKGKCADEMFERDLTDGQFTAVRDSISALQTQSTMLQSILKIQKETEWQG